MDRRDFLKRLTAAGLVAASPKLIFDMGAHKHLYSRDPFFETLYQLERMRDPHYQQLYLITGITEVMIGRKQDQHKARNLQSNGWIILPSG